MNAPGLGKVKLWNVQGCESEHKSVSYVDGSMAWQEKRASGERSPRHKK